MYEEPKRAPSSYIENGKTYASTIALFDKERGSLVPLEGAWMPRIDDMVVGTVTDSRNKVYTVDLLHFGRALLIEGRYERSSLNVGDIIEAKIKDIEDRKTIILEYPKVLAGGVLITVKPTKIPRIIGKEDTMIKQIAESTKTKIAVGHNGVIWIKGTHISLAVSAISIIESEAQRQGLTEYIRDMLNKELSNNRANGE